jgi:hypothetical protein
LLGGWRSGRRPAENVATRRGHLHVEVLALGVEQLLAVDSPELGQHLGQKILATYAVALGDFFQLV